MNDEATGTIVQPIYPAEASDHHWYEIRLESQLDASWAEWLGGLDLRWDDDGTTVLRGPIADQAALHGLLARVRDLGVPLLALTRLDAQQRDAPPVR